MPDRSDLYEPMIEAFIMEISVSLMAVKPGTTSTRLIPKAETTRNISLRKKCKTPEKRMLTT
jgi:hypothetical protein